MDFQTICRVCTCENSGMLSIFDSYNFSTHNYEIFKVITACASVQIQKFDGFSEQICRGCLDLLSQAYRFTKLCEDSDYKFRNNLIASNKIEVKNEFYVEEIICTEDDNCTTENSDEGQWKDAIKTEINEIEDGELDSASLFSDLHEKLEYNRLHCIENVTSGNYDSEYKCGLCNKSCATKKYLALHMEIHAKQRQHKLFAKADYKFINGFIENNKIALKNEICEEDYVINYGEIHPDIIEINDDGSKADQCNERTRSKSEKKEIKQPCLESPKSNFPYKCGLCIKSYRTKRALTLHSYSHKQDNASYDCTLCSKTYETKRSLTLHMHVHKSDHIRPEKLFVCYTCDKICTRKDDLAKHVRIHSGERPYKCDICNKSFAERGNLQKHIRLHSEERPYKCGVCERRFKIRSNLTKHEVVHSEEKPYKCGFCGRQFNQKLQLGYHVASHTGERRFKCEFCDKRFLQKDGLVKHIRSHTGEKPYGCNLCEKKYARPESLREHTKKIHMSESLKKHIRQAVP